jgi:hypothetical protein
MLKSQRPEANGLQKINERSNSASYVEFIDFAAFAA